MKKNLVILFIAIMASSMIAKGQLPGKVKTNEPYTTASGLKIMFTEYKPKNEAPKQGDKVKLNILGKLTNDSIFVNTADGGEPIKIIVGDSKIKGLDEALTYMHIGDKAVLTIPPALAFGDKPITKVPPNSTIILTIELVKIMPHAVPFDTKGKDTVKLKDGLKYIIVSKGRGVKVDSGMNVSINYSGYFENGKMFESSVEQGNPIEGLPIGTGKVIKGWDEAITHMFVGDKARIIIPYQLAYGENARGPIPAKSNLIFDIEILKAIKPIVAEPYKVAGKDTITTASGLKYIVVEKGKGAKAENGKFVSVHYTGYFLDGKKFDSSVERDKPFGFVLGHKHVIAGWDEGVALMNVGSKIRLIVPYQLAYGEKDYQSIPGKSTLIFDIELLDVTTVADN